MVTSPAAMPDNWGIVIPAFNESGVIEHVVRTVIHRHGNVVMVDDCSAEDTSSWPVEAAPTSYAIQST